MKKWLVFLYPITCILIILCATLFGITLLKKEDDKKKESIKKNEEIKEKEDIEYKANETIRVKMTKTGEIVAMDINDYIRGVLPSEMPPSYNIEALKAQALVARTYTYRRMQDKAEGDAADICDSFAHCQAFYPKEKIVQIWKGRGFNQDLINEYSSKVNEAVVSTEKKAIVYNGQYIKAFFHASSPVKTENIDQIWGGEKLPYLSSVESNETLEYENRTSKVEISFEDVISKLKEDSSSRNDLSKDEVLNACINEYTTSGRVKNIKIGNHVISAEKLRTLFGLKATKFTISKTDTSLIFDVVGYGHGVGLSQVGANFYAINNGFSYEQIIKHYYTGVEIVQIL